MKIIIGDILDVVSANGGILVHQVNCQRVAGAGLALQIRQRWPEWYEEYRSTSAGLGDASVFSVPKVGVIIFSLYAQQGYGRNTVQTDYVAFDKGLQGLQRHVDNIRYDGNIFFPHGIGCGLAGGFWPAIHRIIRRRFPDAPIVQLPETIIADGNLLLDNIAK